MNKWLSMVLLITLTCSCSPGSFEVPKKEYQSRVQVLAVAPFLVDRQAPFRHPQQEALFDLVSRSNRGKHELLAEQLRKQKDYFDVRTLSADPELLKGSLLAGPPARDRFGRPLGYEFDRAAVAEVIRRNVVDALLVVVFSGARVEETRRSRTLLESLTTDFNDLVVTAAVIDRNGDILWRMAGKDSFQAAALQYADFDEAYYNRTDQVRVKDIELQGVEALFAGKPEAEQPPKMYRELFERIIAGISPGLLDSL